MEHVFKLVCRASQITEAVSGGDGFEGVNLAKQGVELFACCGTVSAGGAQFCECGLDLFKLVLEVGQVGSLILAGWRTRLKVRIFRLGLDVSLRLLFVEVTFYGIENTVDELSSLVSREPARDFECFVNCDGARSRLVQEFVDGEAQDVAVYNGHT